MGYGQCGGVPCVCAPHMVGLACTYAGCHMQRSACPMLALSMRMRRMPPRACAALHCTVQTTLEVLVNSMRGEVYRHSQGGSALLLQSRPSGGMGTGSAASVAAAYRGIHALGSPKSVASSPSNILLAAVPQQRLPGAAPAQGQDAAISGVSSSLRDLDGLVMTQIIGKVGGHACTHARMPPCMQPP